MWINIGKVILLIVVLYVVVAFLSAFIYSLLCQLRNALILYVNKRNMWYSTWNWVIEYALLYGLYYFREGVSDFVSRWFSVKPTIIIIMVVIFSVLPILRLVYRAKWHALPVLLVKLISLPIDLIMLILYMVQRILQMEVDDEMEVDMTIDERIQRRNEAQKQAEENRRYQQAKSQNQQQHRPQRLSYETIVDGQRTTVYQDPSIYDALDTDFGTVRKVDHGVFESTSYSQNQASNQNSGQSSGTDMGSFSYGDSGWGGGSDT